MLRTTLRHVTPLTRSTLIFPIKTYSSTTTSSSSSSSSHTSPPPPQEDNHSQDVRQLLLQATLRHVPDHGWTMDSLAQGAADLGLPSVVHGVFPGGPSGLLDAYLTQCQQEFTRLVIEQQQQQQQQQQHGSVIADRVRSLTRLRLNLAKPFARRWPEALAILASTNAPMGFHHLSTVVDDIWFYAGDRSPDMNWYTKRAALATIYSATELYMAQDMSPGFVETDRFLDRRLDEAEWLDGATSQLGTMLSFGAKSLIGSITQSRGH